MCNFTDVPALADKHFHGDQAAAVEPLIRNGPNVKYEPNRTYADAKLIIAWWAAALARRLPSGMAVYAVSPGAATDTRAERNVVPALRYLFIPIVNLIPGMNETFRHRLSCKASSIQLNGNTSKFWLILLSQKIET